MVAGGLISYRTLCWARENKVPSIDIKLKAFSIMNNRGNSKKKLSAEIGRRKGQGIKAVCPRDQQVIPGCSNVRGAIYFGQHSGKQLESTAEFAGLGKRARVYLLH